MLKLLAALLMVIDHAGVIFLDTSTTAYTLARLVGRLSMPIFAYKVASGFIYTKDFKRYLSRLGIMMLATQIPFTLLWYGDTFSTNFETMGLSIFLSNWSIGLTFACALLILHQYRQRSLQSYLMLFALLLLSTLGDYGLYGVGMVIIFYAYQSKHTTYNQTLLLLTALAIYQSANYGIGYFVIGLTHTLPSLLSFYLIHRIPDGNIKLPKYFFYIFYPLHMVLLLLLDFFLHTM